MQMTVRPLRPLTAARFQQWVRAAILVFGCDALGATLKRTIALPLQEGSNFSQTMWDVDW